jgi:hypothetical protein
MLRLPHFLDNQLTDGSKVVSVMHRLLFTPRKIANTQFCYRLSGPQVHSATGRIRSIEKSNDFIRSQTQVLPACNTVPQPTTLLTHNTKTKRSINERFSADGI